MHYKALLTTLGLAALAAFSACSYDKEELANPNACNTAGTTYRQHILPVLQNSCYSCHSSAAAAQHGRNISLEGYSQVQPWVLNGKLLAAINHAPTAPAMPQGGPKLDNCTLARFSAWVGAGAPDN
ncbi:hypothetical protein [Flaviaesturariibacter amylovorans]|uniref:Cytochrome c domain-containing protein n=1 Tax=Flaviaesturariibacter amylovorans TaxID=1084520 RepID=A0ABP8GMX3_9BACT